MTSREEIVRFMKEHDNDIKELGISKGKVTAIINNYYKYMKQEMEDSELPTIRLRFLGKFTPAYQRLEYHIKGLKESYEKGNVDENIYKQKLEKYEEIKGLKSKRLYG